MQKTEMNRLTGTNRRQVKTSTTLNRKYLKTPGKSRSDEQGVADPNVKVSIKSSPKIARFYTPEATSQAKKVAEKESVNPHPIQQAANSKMQRRKIAISGQEVKTVTAKELKDQAIQKALLSAESTPVEDEKASKKANKIHFGVGRVMLALGCAVAAVFAVVYFVNLNMPDISLRVAAMQTGINPSYPKYVPRDYSVSSITSEEEKITLEFKNDNEGQKFSLIEEKSAWDTNALLSNYVKKEYGESYSIVREQGLTIYISGSDSLSGINTVARSDVNIFAVVNPKKNKMLLVSTPRDYYVQLHGTTGLMDKLTHAGLYGLNMSKQTLEDLYDQITSMLE